MESNRTGNSRGQGATPDQDDFNAFADDVLEKLRPEGGGPASFDQLLEALGQAYAYCLAYYQHTGFELDKITIGMFAPVFFIVNTRSLLGFEQPFAVSIEVLSLGSDLLADLRPVALGLVEWLRKGVLESEYICGLVRRTLGGE